jgi:hypothetical protein
VQLGSGAVSEASTSRAQDPIEFFDRFGSTTNQRGSHAVPELVLFYDLLQRYGDHDQPGSQIWFVPLSADACQHHCLYTTVTCGYESVLWPNFIVAAKREELINAYDDASGNISTMCDGDGMHSYTNAHRAMVLMHLATLATSFNATCYSKTAPLFVESSDTAALTEIRESANPAAGQGLFTRKRLENKKEVCRYLGAKARI